MTELANYSVPTAPFEDLTKRWCAEHGMTLEGLSTRCEFERTTLRKLFSKGTCSFDSMDKLVCMTYGPLMWRTSPFREILWQGNPPPDDSKPVKCEHVECEKWFSLPTSMKPGVTITARRFCSRRCRQNHHNRLEGKQPKGHETHCRNNHSYEEHGYTDPRGRKVCRICRSKARKKYEQKTEVREKKAAWAKEYRRKNAA